jgi:hypothetical protein
LFLLFKFIHQNCHLKIVTFFWHILYNKAVGIGEQTASKAWLSEDNGSAGTKKEAAVMGT